jgi:hypothetical protein
MRMSLAILIVLEKFLMASSMETCLSALQLPRPYIVKALRDSDNNVGRFISTSITSAENVYHQKHNVDDNSKETVTEVANNDYEDNENEQDDDDILEEAYEAWAMNRLWTRALGNPLLVTSRINWKILSSSLSSINTAKQQTLQTSTSVPITSTPVSYVESMTNKFQSEDIIAGKRSFVTDEELQELEGDFDALPQH